MARLERLPAPGRSSMVKVSLASRTRLANGIKNPLQDEMSQTSGGGLYHNWLHQATHTTIASVLSRPSPRLPPAMSHEEELEQDLSHIHWSWPEAIAANPARSLANSDLA